MCSPLGPHKAPAAFAMVVAAESCTAPVALGLGRRQIHVEDRHAVAIAPGVGVLAGTGADAAARREGVALVTRCAAVERLELASQSMDLDAHP